MSFLKNILGAFVELKEGSPAEQQAGNVGEKAKIKSDSMEIQP